MLIGKISFKTHIINRQKFPLPTYCMLNGVRSLVILKIKINTWINGINGQLFFSNRDQAER